MLAICPAVILPAMNRIRELCRRRIGAWNELVHRTVDVTLRQRRTHRLAVAQL